MYILFTRRQSKGVFHIRWNLYTDQAIRALVFLAQKREPAASIELANHLGTTQQTVIQNAAPLLRVGMIDVKSGVGGGYFLAKPADTISLYDVIIVMENRDLFPAISSTNAASQRVAMIYSFLQCASDKIFNSISIGQIAFGDADTIRRAEKQALNAAIIAIADTYNNEPLSK